MAVQPALVGAAEGPPKTDSRSPYIHRLNLYDADGTAIKPGAPDAKPYSPEKTCGKCHDMKAISSGWHFNAGAALPGGRPVDGRDERAGEPWLFVDPPTGTVLPMSPYGLPGGFHLIDVGLTPWQFTQRFGKFTCGGGLGDNLAQLIGRDSKPIKDPKARWEISGKLEIDCLSCHARANWDINEWAAQIERQNYAWAPTAAAGLGVIRGRADKVPDDFDPLAPPSPDFPERALPKTIYNKALFDPDDRIFFDMPKNPPDARCYACHTVRRVGANVMPGWNQDKDVHLSAGLTCTDCHRHGLDHRIVRGYEGESAAQRIVQKETFGLPPSPVLIDDALTCRGCHLGKGEQSASGKLRAPRPKHAGLPQIHLDKIACTGCHSGPWPGKFAGRVQTSRAHGLGISSQTRTADTPPYAVQPIFANFDGQIRPYRMVWPSFWGYLEDGAITPLAPEFVSKTAGQALKIGRPSSSRPAAPTVVASDETFDLDTVDAVLHALKSANKDRVEPAYIAYGRLYSIDERGGINIGWGIPGSWRVAWPLAHDVRPATQSLGSAGCTDCHSADAPFIFQRVRLPALEPHGSYRVFSANPWSIHLEYVGAGPGYIGPSEAEETANYHRYLAMSFVFRPYLKIVGFAASGIMAFVLMIYISLGFVGIMRKMFG